uniref:Small RNA 2'-O-methyltransferase n=1 Tax=Cajanus cajan TaxID=3821 RepID=A0A151S4B2_CAJCA|nr:UPF0486 protein C1orf59 isogeny [Cajanus cajan]
MGPCLYRCTLQLPELSVISGIFKKKKDAEQSAAEIAIEKLGICPETIDPTPQEAQESLVARIAYIFSEKFLICDHPLSGHIRATLWREGDLCGLVPLSVIAVYDAKIFSLCRCINPEVESDPFLVISYIMRATANLYQFLATSERHLWIRRQSPYPQDIIESLMKEDDGSQECIQVAAIRIPSSVEQSIEDLTLHISLKEYYLDIIANELGFQDAANILISRSLGKASSETRLFFAAPKSYLLDLYSNFPNGKETLYFKGSLNARASYFAGQNIIGDAILATIGYTRKSRDLFYEDVTVRLYYRGIKILILGEDKKGTEKRVMLMLLGKTPGGIYKLSREAILASELPSKFTTRANWRGSLPRDILCMFCRQHRLSEPLFSITCHPFNTLSGLSGLSGSCPYSGVCPCNGSLPCIRYSVSLAVEGENVKEVIEVCDEFEFEVGLGAVVFYIEEVVTQMSVGQYAHFTTNLLTSDLIFASADDSVKMPSLLSSKDCCLEYEISLIKVTEPPEERMEQALFSPPLSKQRVEFAVQQILESHASTLIDFGCGSGSLLEALLNYPTSLEKMAGVDISQKGLSRAAKILNSKLVTNSDAGGQWTSIKSVILYEGSITNFGSQLHGFDIGTCLEVIEHMDEDQACLFGDVALSSFRPRILIVSTPNFEYNVVLQRSNPPSQEQEESDEKTLLQSCKFRNHDHKFEWTREQFRQWACDLAARHNYKVHFSGVGGSADVEPGFASQIAVFKRDWKLEDDVLKHADEHHYNVIWEWNRKIE